MSDAATKGRPARPIRDIDGVPITMEMIRAALLRSEPGQGIMGMHIEDMYAYPYYTEWLLDRLAEATTPRASRFTQAVRAVGRLIPRSLNSVRLRIAALKMSVENTI